MVHAQSTPAAPLEPRSALSNQATGDWGDVRPALESHGVRVEGVHTSDWTTGWGRPADSSFAGRGLLDLRTTVTRGSTTASAQLLSKNGGDGTLVGRDLQGYSNIDAESFTRLGELWLEQSLPGGAIRVKTGRVDANSEFARNEHSGDFLNSSMGYSPTILLPTYPRPAPSVNVFVQPFAGLDVGVGVYHRAQGEGAPENLLGSGLFTITEAGWRWGGDGANRVAVGYWRHTGDFHGHDEAIVHGTAGFHIVVDQWIRRTTSDGPGSVSAFVKMGFADADVTPFDRHIGGGASWLGPLRSRANDALGMGATWVRGRGDDGTMLRELALGPFYRVQVTSWAALTPDVQIIRTIDAPDARGVRVAITCRVVVSF
jgi:carbohydrate-selective porin OprB